jgi:hypothetical protein
VTSEYGVGPGTAAPAVHLNETATGTITGDSIPGWLVAHLSGPNPPLGRPDPNTIYVLFYPSAVTISDADCTQAGAYHDIVIDAGTLIDAGAGIVFAVVPRCPGFIPGATDVDTMTSSASHELVEASTDPDYFVPGWGSADDDHAVWNLMVYGEVGDLCELDADSFYTPANYPYMVQRTWSNVAAQQSGYGCVPAASPYFGVVPLLNDSVSYSFFGVSGVTKGISIPMGQTRTLELVVFSEGPTNPITLNAYSVGDPNALAMTLIDTGGVNGDVLRISVQHVSGQGGVPFAVEATLGGRKHTTLGFVGD